jgi:hypothetical protein
MSTRRALVLPPAHQSAAGPRRSPHLDLSLFFDESP